MEFANQRAFDLDPQGLEAKGLYLSTVIQARSDGADVTHGQGGIVNPRRHILRPGATIVRFAGNNLKRSADGTVPKNPEYLSAALPHLALKGAWWLEWSDYSIINQVASSGKMSFEEAWRSACQVPPEWSDMQLVVQARVCRPLLAWKGLGRPVPSASQRGQPVQQLFIPGLQFTGREQMIAMTGAGYNAGYD